MVSFTKSEKEALELAYSEALSFLIPKADYYAPSNLRREHEDKEMYEAYDRMIQMIVEDYIKVFETELTEQFYSSQCDWLDEDRQLEKFESKFQEWASEYVYDLSN